MSYEYLDPQRAESPISLPDVEIWADEIAEVDCPMCGQFDLAQRTAEANQRERDVVVNGSGDIFDVDKPDKSQGQFSGTATFCPSCEKQTAVIVNTYSDRIGYWYAFGLPGCLSDSSTFGPFDSYALALADAQDVAGLED